MRRLDNAIWFEKYRPKSLEQMTLHSDMIYAFDTMIKEQEIPHLCLYGPPGSGKTTLAQIIMNKVPCVTLTLNASSKDRGIDTVRVKIRQFAQSKQQQGLLKIVFLDEADYMTTEAQAALRNTMETYSKYCRFILTANFIHKIIDPIKSRCRMYHLDEFPIKGVIEMLQRILKRELVKVPVEALEEIVDRFYPDIRTIINELQIACAGGKFDIKKIKSMSVDLNELENLILKGRLFDLRDLLINLTDYSFIYRWLYDDFLRKHGTAVQKQEMVDWIAEFNNSDAYTPDKEINFAGCASRIMGSMDIPVVF